MNTNLRITNSKQASVCTTDGSEYTAGVRRSVYLQYSISKNGRREMMSGDFSIIDDMAEIVLIENECGVIRYVNKAFCACHGVTFEEAVGRSCFDFIIPEDREACNMEQKVTPENPYYRIEGRSIRADGRTIWLQYVGRAYFREDGSLREFQEIGVDITAWKEKIEESARSIARTNKWVEQVERRISWSTYSQGMDRHSGNLQAMYRFSDIHTSDPEMKTLISYAGAVAAGNATVLIEGESGTGKELFAQAIHNASLRSNGPFVAINCGVIPPELISSEFFGYVEGAFTGASKGGRAGKFEMASGGTLFLDEIGEMPMAQQVALLRVLETRMVSRIGDSSQIPVDVRIICATNKNLYDEVKAGRFRSDLYYRLNVINLHIPPLRERKGDIYLLIGAFIKKFGSGNFNKKESFSDEKLIAFYEYDWPGNVRELQNVVERMMYVPEHMTRHFYESLIGELKKDRAAPEHGDGSRTDENRKTDNEREMLIKLLADCEGNVSMAARKLGISRTGIYRKLKKHDIR